MMMMVTPTPSISSSMVDMVNVVSTTSGDFTRLLNVIILKLPKIDKKRLPETIIIKTSPENPLVDFQNNFKFLHVPRNFLETKKQFDVSLISLHKVHPKSPQKGPSKLRFGLRSDKTKIENETYN